MNRMQRQDLAKWGEEKAKSFLEGKNIHILETNFRTRDGEIDIIGKDEDGFIFFEVKTRSSTQFGYPEEAVNFIKIHKIELVANEYLILHSLDDVNWRIDTIAIMRNQYNGKFEIKWFKNVDA